MKSLLLLLCLSLFHVHGHSIDCVDEACNSLVSCQDAFCGRSLCVFCQKRHSCYLVLHECRISVHCPVCIDAHAMCMIFADSDAVLERLHLGFERCRIILERRYLGFERCRADSSFIFPLGKALL